MTRILLIYPYFKPKRDRSVFRFPPLGVSYIAASLTRAGHEVTLLDCTFLNREEALEQALAQPTEVVGIYCMVTMLEDALWFARQLHQTAKLLMAGGPLPTCEPGAFLNDFDLVVIGEGENTVVEVLQAYETSGHYRHIPGLALPLRPDQADEDPEIIFTEERPFIEDLDSLPFPSRQLLPNAAYIQFGRKKYGYAITSVMSTRGCPYDCEFCSNVIFGGSYRERSAKNVIDEIEQALALGYERVSFADDVFTLRKKRVLEMCAEIERRGLKYTWECLARVDSLDDATYGEMYRAGCRRVYFGIESGDDTVLKLMNKKITVAQARQAVLAAHQARLEVGAFFILFYPGESKQTALNTLRFATSLPLDYLGLTMPYPLPGTRLYERVKDKIRREWRPGESIFGSHVLIYHAEFSEARMWLGIIKGHMQFRLKRSLGKIAPLIPLIFEKATDWLFLHL